MPSPLGATLSERTRSPDSPVFSLSLQSSVCRLSATQLFSMRATSCSVATSASAHGTLEHDRPGRAAARARPHLARRARQRRQHADHRQQPHHRCDVRHPRRVLRGLSPVVYPDPRVSNARRQAGPGRCAGQHQLDRPHRERRQVSVNVAAVPSYPSGYRIEIYGRECSLLVRTDRSFNISPSSVHAGKWKESIVAMPFSSKYRVVPDSTPTRQSYNVAQSTRARPSAARR